MLRRGPQGKRSEVASLVEDERRKIVIGGEGLFKTGSAVLTAKAKRILQYDAVPELVGFNNRVEIIGHAAKGEGGEFADAWVLASSRAYAVMRFLVDDCGMEEIRFRLVNSGSNEPRDPENPLSNQRVEVVMTERLVNGGP